MVYMGGGAVRGAGGASSDGVAVAYVEELEEEDTVLRWEVGVRGREGRRRGVEEGKGEGGKGGEGEGEKAVGEDNR